MGEMWHLCELIHQVATGRKMQATSYLMLPERERHWLDRQSMWTGVKLAGKLEVDTRSSRGKSGVSFTQEGERL